MPQPWMPMLDLLQKTKITHHSLFTFPDDSKPKKKRGHDLVHQDYQKYSNHLKV